jgi:tetratricopeptide (TPR) repeat protein
LVFAAVDTDKLEAAPFVNKYPLRAWPTFFVIDPVTGAALAEHGGSLSLPELQSFIDQALRARDPSAAQEPQVKALLLGHRAMGQKDYASAAQHYVDAVVAGGPRTAEATVAVNRANHAAKNNAACVEFGVSHLDTLKTSSSASDFVGDLVSCATALDSKDPARKRALDLARARIEALTNNPPVGASVDDKADALGILADIAEAQKDDAAFTAAHEKRLAILEADVASHAFVDDKRVQDYARMNSYIALHRGADAVAMLTERTQQLPDSYEAWARLASALHQLHRDEEAVPAAKKAISLSYGPRRLRYDTLLADICAANKDAAGEASAVKQLVVDADSLPEGQRDDTVIKAAHQRAETAGAAGAAGASGHGK